MGAQRMDICFLEDDDNDVFIIQRALIAAHLPIKPSFFRRFEQLQNTLSLRLIESKLPDIVVTDLKLTGEDGFAVLSWIKGHPRLNTIPVIVLTSSTVEKDRARCELLGASAFVTKSCSIRSLATSFESAFQPFLSRISVEVE